MLRPSTANSIIGSSSGGGWKNRHAAMRRAWARTRTLGRDAVRLLRSMYRTTPNTPSGRRDLLLRQAADGADNNAAAVKLLQWERELNLLRYYGIRGYWREKKLLPPSSSLTMPSFPFSSSSSGTTTTTTTTTTREHDSSSSSPSTDSSTAGRTETAIKNSDNKSPRGAVVARVPFMITARMRQDLAQQLGYEPSQIAAQTPVEATLILEHRVPPDELPVKLPALVKAHEAEQRRAAEEAAAERRKQQQQQLQAEQERRKEAEARNKIQSEQQQQQQQVPSELSVPQTAELSAAESALAEAPFAAEPADNAATGGGTTWHQVVEISHANDNDDDDDDDDDDEQQQQPPPQVVVGMFLDIKEAEFARSVHQELADERAAEKAKKKKSSQQQQQQPQQSLIGASSTYEIRTVVKD